MSVGRLLLTFVGLATSIGCYVADYNETHVFNPAWPPHAKFHNGQTMSLGLTLGLLTQYYTWRPSYNKDSLLSACITGWIYWLTQGTAIAYPGTSWIDPPHGSTERSKDGLLEGPQLVLFGVASALIGTAWVLESRRLDRLSLKKKKN